MRTSSIESPVFILGCGRSGTTILGNLLAQHPSVTYLHEHRPLWTSAYPETDIWSEHAITRRLKRHLSRRFASPITKRGSWNGASARRRLRHSSGACHKTTGSRCLTPHLWRTHSGQASGLQTFFISLPNRRCVTLYNRMYAATARVAMALS